jgi:hypothetical protein
MLTSPDIQPCKHSAQTVTTANKTDRFNKFNALVVAFASSLILANGLRRCCDLSSLHTEALPSLKPFRNNSNTGTSQATASEAARREPPVQAVDGPS